MLSISLFWIVCMRKSLERKNAKKPKLPYDLEEPTDERAITGGLMRLSQQALSKYMDKETDLY